jgi:hypothetical protein
LRRDNLDPWHDYKTAQACQGRTESLGQQSASRIALPSQIFRIVAAVSETIMFAHGFKRKTLAGLIRTGLATADRKTVRITDAGRKAIEE